MQDFSSFARDVERLVEAVQGMGDEMKDINVALALQGRDFTHMKEHIDKIEKQIDSLLSIDSRVRDLEKSQEEREKSRKKVERLVWAAVLGVLGLAVQTVWAYYFGTPGAGP